MSGSESGSDVETRLVRALREQLQFEHFRSAQLEAPSAVLSGRDVIVKITTLFAMFYLVSVFIGGASL